MFKSIFRFIIHEQALCSKTFTTSIQTYQKSRTRVPYSVCRDRLSAFKQTQERVIVSNKSKTSAIIYAEIPQLSRRSLVSTGYLTTSMLPSPKQWATTDGKSKAKAFLSNACQPEVDFLILTKNRLHTRTDTKQYKFVSINAYSKGKNASLPVNVCLSRRQ